MSMRGSMDEHNVRSFGEEGTVYDLQASTVYQFQSIEILQVPPVDVPPVDMPPIPMDEPIEPEVVGVILILTFNVVASIISCHAFGAKPFIALLNLFKKYSRGLGGTRPQEHSNSS